MRSFSPTIILALLVFMGACRHKPDVPMSRAPNDQAETIEPRTTSADPSLTTPPESTPNEEPTSLGAIDGAIAANPTPKTPVEATPTLDRQTVVVGNGRFEPLFSAWYRFPTDHKTLNQVVAYLQKTTKDPAKELKIVDSGEWRYLCLSSENQMEIVRLLFDRFLLATPDVEARHFTSSNRCGGANVPDFTKAKEILKEEPELSPTFVCSSLAAPAKHTLFIHDFRSSEGRYAAYGKSLDLEHFTGSSESFKTSTLSFGTFGDPSLKMETESSSIELFPFQSFGETFLTRVKWGEADEADYQCRMSYRSPS